MATTIPVVIIGLIAAFLAFHEDYDDGFLGRLSFAVMLMMAAIMSIGYVLGYYTYHVPLELSVLLWAIAAFLLRHAWRFVQYQTKGRFAWNGRDRRAMAWDGNDRRSGA